jgi:hypothetical protein
LFVEGFRRAFHTVGSVTIIFVCLEVLCVVVGMMLLKKVQELRQARQQGTDANGASDTTTSVHAVNGAITPGTQ